MSIDVDERLRELRPDDAERSHELFPVARRAEMMRGIVDGGHRPSHVHRSRQFSFAALVVAIAVAVTVTLASGSPGGGVRAAAAEGIRFETAKDGDIIAVVTDPYAALRNLRAAFAQRGFDISLSLVPVSPGLVGTVVFMGGDAGTADLIRSLAGGRCVPGGGSCQIGLAISTRFSGSASVTLGRAARAGERYATSTSAFGPGEVLHCTGLFGGRVSSLLSVLAGKRLHAEWTDDDSPTNATIHEPSGAEYVRRAELVAADLVRVEVTRKPIDPIDVAGDIAHFNAYLAQLDAGCPK
jgi:hypothetical protein